MKVTYEEAQSILMELHNTASLNGPEGAFQRIIKDSFSVINNFIEQHKPPTWEEVINAWEMCGYKLHKNTDNNLMFRLGGSRLHSFDIYANGKVKISDTIRYIRSDELDAINLTIRYLENQQ